ncbi:MAG: HlyD family efflux transporter periplasmic adaptor subunit, partial [Planctomycetes bacterium]|nr:HlyD family efflux transporter periplasmic adaptor subunit [Planctomycetota bacterium]
DTWIPDCNTFVDSDECPKVLKSYIRAQGIKSFWAKVLKDEEGVLGIFSLESNSANFLSEQQREVFGILANQSTVAIRNAQLYHKVPIVSFFEKIAGKDSTWASMSRAKQAIVASFFIVFLAIVFVIPNPYTSVSGDFVVSARTKRTLYAPIDGQIEAVYVSKGDRVEVNQAIARFRLRDKELERETAVHKRDDVARQLNQATGTERITFQNELARLDLEIERLEEEISRATVRSPIAGYVVTEDMHALVGKLLRNSEPICDVEDFDRVAVDVSIPEKDFPYVHKPSAGEEAQLVNFKASAFGSPFAGKVTSVSHDLVEEAEENVFKVKVELPNPPVDEMGKLLPGMTGSARIDVEPKTLFWQFLHWLDLR